MNFEFIITTRALETRMALDVAVVLVFLVGTLKKVSREQGHVLKMR